MPSGGTQDPQRSNARFRPLIPGPDPSPRITLTFYSLDYTRESVNSRAMDVLVIGPALAAALGVSLFTGKMALRLLMSRILRQRAAR